MEQNFDIKTIKAIIGLGNPGGQYARQRHNIGFRIIDGLADRLGALWQHRDNLEWAQATLSGSAQEIILVKPLTFMNNSGGVISWLQKKGIKPEQILVMHDELEKTFGSHMFKFGGSHRGHNGLKSIAGAMGLDFWRLRFGIGRPDDKAAVPDYVLSNFLPSEEQLVPALVEKIVDFLLRGN